MRVRFENRNRATGGADIEELTMLVRPDGTVVTSLPDAYCNERLITPEEADKAIEFLNQKRGGRTQYPSTSANAKALGASSVSIRLVRDKEAIFNRRSRAYLQHRLPKPSPA